jgi:cytochrome b561
MSKPMNPRNATERYGSLSIALHWLMLLLLVGVYACINLSDLFPKGSGLREGLKTWHFTLGLSVLALVWLRLAARLVVRAPPADLTSPKWQQLSAKAVHFALYAFMILTPLVGWLVLSARGKPIPFFGVELPALLGASEALAKTLKEVHEAGGTGGYFLVGLHAAAALFHHYVRKDHTIRRMLPKWLAPDPA